MAKTINKDNGRNYISLIRTKQFANITNNIYLHLIEINDNSKIKRYY